MREGEMAIDDSRLVQAITEGELDAWAEVISKYQQPIYYFIIRMVKQHQQAADLTQQVFVQAYRKVNQLRSGAQLRPWLYKIALNRCKNYFRLIRRHRFMDIAETELVDDYSVLEEIIDRENKRRLQQAVDRLPRKQRLTVVFRVYQGLSYKEIAHILGCSIDTVKANFYHAINGLKDLMLKEEVRS
jgi:RNA polymerase sigma-70 factor (ECF subfamily)